MIQLLKLLLGTGSAAVVILLTIASIRTLSLDVNAGVELGRWPTLREPISLDIDQRRREELLTRFQEAIRIPTVSFSATERNTTALLHFNSFLRRAFPTLFTSSSVHHQVVANYSHLFWVPGSQPDLAPYLLLAHIDVVPATESDGWLAPPFSAQERDGFIYGRGTIDDKGSLMGILQALEYLLMKGYAPRRGFYIGLGHDEEVGGQQGAQTMARLLKRRNVRLSFVLDEGLAVLDGVIGGLRGPAALIGVSEKGLASVRLSVSTLPGHASMPSRQSSIGILAAAVQRFLEQKPDSNAFVRTTTAVTIFKAGVKSNIMPSMAEAHVNLRIHSAQSLREVLDLIRSTVGDPRVEMELIEGFDPLPVSSFDEKSFGFQMVKKSILDLFPTVAVAPGICVGNTDSRHFKDLSDDIYRFAPLWFKPGDAERFHGIDERISHKNYEELVVFYSRLIQNADIGELPEPHASSHEL
ncbi:N-fatty-acyl-amino acid synthase/hydrolase PM20D1.2-like isoform 2-T12 [Syngnathus typhle]